jgi:predicted nucleotidyltransferase
MSVSTHLQSIADNAVLSEQERASIQTSFQNLQSRIKNALGNYLTDHYSFGSYTRGTILPRKFDPHSDVDYIVIFRDNSRTPQTYLNYLSSFVKANYPRSEISQSFPTIRLELNPIMFELVPAIDTMGNGLKIPSKSDWSKWQSTDPKGFNTKLINANTSNKSLVKPLVRIMKYWNVQQNWPFESFILENMIVDHVNSLWITLSWNLSDYLFSFVESLCVDWGWTLDKQNKVNRLKQVFALAKSLRDQGFELTSEMEIAKAFPSLLVRR